MDVSGCKTIDDIPEEILEYIIHLLSPYKDYKCAMLVCKQWCRISKGVIHKSLKDFQKAVDTCRLEWVKMPCETKNTITERYSHSAVYYNKILYVFGGCTSTNTTFNDLWCYDLANRVWIRTLGSGSYPSPKACASMVLYKDKLILFGGWSHPTPYPLHQAARFFDQLHMYCTVTHAWQHMVCHNTPQGKAGHAAAVVRDMMLVFGGSHGHGVSSNELWVLNLTDMVWRREETQSKKPQPRYGHSFIVLDDYHLLVMGGCGGPNNQFSDLWLLDTSVSPWMWREVRVQCHDNAPQQLWCHAACRVGDKIVVLSKAHRPPTPLPAADPPATAFKPLLMTKLAQARRAMPDTSGSSSQDSSSDTDDVAQRNIRTVRLRNQARSPHHRPGALGRGGGGGPGGSDPDPAGVAACDMMDVDEVVCVNCKSERDICTCEEGFCPGVSGSSRGSSGSSSSIRSGSSSNSKDSLQTGGRNMSAESLSGDEASNGERVTPFKIPFKSSSGMPSVRPNTSGMPSVRPNTSGMPSVRPNASKNRQKQLDTLRMYEEKFRAKMAAAGVDSKDVKVEGHNVEVVTVKRAVNPMYIHTLDVSRLVAENTVSWLPLAHNCGEVPEETIFYSLDRGRGELVMFGGIQADLGSMQRGLSQDKQVVSKHVYLIRPRALGVR